MKKALVLGALAFFAINVASVQSACAQEKTTAKQKSVKVEKPQNAAVSTTSTEDAKESVNSNSTAASKQKLGSANEAASKKVTKEEPLIGVKPGTKVKKETNAASSSPSQTK